MLKNVKEIQKFLEFVNYNRKFIVEFFKKTLSLIKLINKNIKWKWKKKQQQTFESFKKTCLSNFMLRIIDMTKIISYKTNVSNLIISACLNQQSKKNKWHSIIYYFKKLYATKQNYDIANKKLLTIIIVLNHWRIYAKKAIQLDIYTNHKNLINFIIIKKFQKRQIKWWKKLKFYKFKIHYVKKKENELTNNLNRRCDYMKNKKIFNHNILKINENETFFMNHREITIIMRIIKNQKEQFSMQHEKLQISKKHIDEYIKKHHDESL